MFKMGLGGSNVLVGETDEEMHDCTIEEVLDIAKDTGVNGIRAA